MLEFLMGLFIGASFGFIFAGILAMGRDFDRYAGRKQYRRDLKSSVGLFESRLWRLGRRSL